MYLPAKSCTGTSTYTKHNIQVRDVRSAVLDLDKIVGGDHAHANKASCADATHCSCRDKRANGRTETAPYVRQRKYDQ